MRGSCETSLLAFCQHKNASRGKPVIPMHIGSVPGGALAARLSRPQHPLQWHTHQHQGTSFGILVVSTPIGAYEGGQPSPSKRLRTSSRKNLVEPRVLCRDSRMP